MAAVREMTIDSAHRKSVNMCVVSWRSCTYILTLRSCFNLYMYVYICLHVYFSHVKSVTTLA